MRFTSNAFIISTVALLSLIAPVVNAQATIVVPATGQLVDTGDTFYVRWTISDSDGLDGVNCDIALLHVESAPVPASPGILQSGVPILNGQSNGQVQIPNVPSRDDYYMELISSDQNTVYGQSGLFSIT